jgi:hypothetical protein
VVGASPEMDGRTGAVGTVGALGGDGGFSTTRLPR